MSRRNTGNRNTQSAEHYEGEQPGLSAAIALLDPLAKALRKLAEALSAGLSVSVHQAPSVGKIELDCTDSQRTTLNENEETHVYVKNENRTLKITRAYPHQKRSRTTNDASDEEITANNDPADGTDELRRRKRRSKDRRESRQSEGRRENRHVKGF
jgi:hypothetical protein